MLSCYTWVMVVLMDNNDEMCYTFMLYLWMLIQDHMFNWNMENHPGQQCNHKGYMALVLAE
jgi:hypothetical protein